MNVDIPAHGKLNIDDTVYYCTNTSDSFTIDVKNPRILEVGNHGYDVLNNAKYPPNAYGATEIMFHPLLT